MTVKLQRHIFTVEDYYKMAEAGILEATDRVELINGEIIEMSPINSAHAGIVNFLSEFLTYTLYKKASICIQNPLRINNTSEPEPDVLITSYQSDNYRYRHPVPNDVLYLIEVSDSTLQYDRSTKKELYAKAGILEYWIVNIGEQQVEVFTNPKGDDYAQQGIYTVEDELVCTTIDFKIAVKDLF